MSAAPRTSPPALARRLVAMTLPRPHRAACLGDLDDRYEKRAARSGRIAARAWYWRQAAGFLLRVPIARLLAFDRVAERTGAGSRNRSDTRHHSVNRQGSAPPDPPHRHGGLRIAIEALARDLAYAVRSLRLRPGFTIPAVIILALAIGANAAVLSIVDNLLLRRLPVTDPEQLVLIWDLLPPGERSDPRMPISYDHYRLWQDRDDLFASVAALDSAFPTVETDAFTIRPEGAFVSGNIFELLGARAALGRALTDADEAPQAAPVILLSNRFWRRDFGGDPDIVGRVVSVGNVPTTIVGVMPADFWFFDPYGFIRSGAGRETEQPDFWQPLAGRNWDAYGTDAPLLRVLARLRDDVTLQQATDAVAAQGSALALEEARDDVQVGLTPLSEAVLGEKRGRLLLLQGAVTMLVLIACVNLMSLVLAKGATTRNELAVRAALGAGRASLIRLAASEAMLLGIGGGLLGLLAARSFGGVILSLAPRDLPLADRVAVDGRVALITMGVAIAAGLTAGVLPTLRLDFGALTRALSSGSRSVAGDAAASRSRFALLAVEVALTLVLLIGATVMLRSFVGAWRSDPGFERNSVLTYFIVLSGEPGNEADAAFHDRLLDRVRGLPGVVSAGGTTHLPFTNWGNAWPIVVGEAVPMEEAPRIDGRWVTPDYVETMGIEVRAGRDFARADDEHAEPVVLVNEAFVERFFATSDATGAVGRVIGVGKYAPARIVPHRIIGVVENVKTGRLFEAARPLVYQSTRQDPKIFLRHVVRTSGSPMSLAGPIRRLAAEIDRRQPITEVYPLESMLADSLAEERFYTQLLSAFGIVAFALAAIGIYGSVAYTTRLRLREFGIRIAFGARPGEVRRLIVARGLAPVALGVLAGCAGATVLVRGLESLLHGVSPIDPLSFAAGAGIFLLVAAVAAFLPARRASRVDPIEVLRAD